MKKSQNNLTDAEILRQKAEEQLKKKQPKVSSLSSENDMRKLAHELQAHQIELGMQYEQLKKAKEEADAATQKYTELYDFAPSGYFTLTKLGEIIELNLHGARLLGKERLRLINKRFGSSVSDQTKPIFNHFLDKVFTSKGNQSCELTLSVESKNIPTYVYLTGHVLENGEKCLISVVDITERKKAEEALSQSEENFRRSISESILGIRIVSVDGETIYANEAFLDIFEYNSLEEFRSTPAINRYTPESYAQHQIRKEKRKNGHDIFDYEISIIGKNAEIRHVKVSRKEVLWNGNKHYQVINLDITEQKKLTLDLIAAKNKAEQSDRLKSAFLANMSHEIRTPMNGILGFADLLREPGLTGEKQQEYISIIEKSGDRMLNIINDLINISKIEAGQMEVSVSETNINEQLNYIYIFFKPEAENKGLQLRLKKTLNAKEAIIKTDKEKIYAVLMNLVKNAIKFTSEGSIELGYNIKHTNQKVAGEPVEPAILEFFVKDTGIGVAKDKAEAIFERFIKADISLSSPYEGAGLGLSISKGYVEMLGGKIWLESEAGKGTVFYFTIPYNAVTEKGIFIKNVVTVAEEDNRIKNLKILIAEDDEMSKKFIEIAIEKFGKEVINVKTGVEAVDVCMKNTDIDLVLMDIRMPDMDGYEAVKQIRKFNSEVVIIAQTALALPGDRENAFAAGCNDYISKPIKKEELMNLIQKYFKQ